MQGSEWLPWPAGNNSFVPSEEDLNTIKNNKRSIGRIEVHGIWLHSFKTDFGKVWDEYNGWRT